VATQKKTAGALDIRNVIGALLAIYGVILTLMGLFGDTETEKTGGPNANLWSGLAMLVVGIGFIVWSRLKPVVVAEEPADQG
jgi:hypothetical protein